MRPILEAGNKALSALTSVGEICAIGALAWAFFFPEDAAKKVAEFQNKVEAAQAEMLGKLEEGNKIAEAIAASNRAIEVSNRAIEASSRALEASNEAIVASTQIIARETAAQTPILQSTENNTAVAANEALRLSAVAQGLKVGAFMMSDIDGSYDFGAGIGNSSTSSLADVQLEILTSQGNRIFSSNFGMVNRGDESLVEGTLDTTDIDPSDLLSLSVCIRGLPEGESEFLYVQAKIEPTQPAKLMEAGATDNVFVEWVSVGLPTVSEAPSSNCI
ncbi:hypothetical protein [Paracoccus sp. PARArs4]|uniref:hypothetical protein n=1 Tax=Paracoccus sp. PARArs4 TaxID=2853442 RepID=UPI0024A60E91|nr:hypothetical protein [Paracoccus sp. PARArs4]